MIKNQTPVSKQLSEYSRMHDTYYSLPVNNECDYNQTEDCAQNNGNNWTDDDHKWAVRFVLHSYSGNKKTKCELTSFKLYCYSTQSTH